jgi:hypothetical protein
MGSFIACNVSSLQETEERQPMTATPVKTVIVGLVLFVCLIPGFILSLPPVPADAEHDTLDKRVYRTGVVTPMSVLAHAFLFVLLFGGWEYFTNK